jgi:hypothetical protein
VTNRGFKIHKGKAKAKDKRMAVLDELISSVRCLVNLISALGPECAAVDQIDQVLCLGGALD